MSKFKPEKIKYSDIIDEITVCPYCMNDVRYDSIGCCGESSAHFSHALLLKNGECYLESEVLIEYSILDHLSIQLNLLLLKIEKIKYKLKRVFK